MNLTCYDCDRMCTGKCNGMDSICEQFKPSSGVIAYVMNELNNLDSLPPDKRALFEQIIVGVESSIRG